MSASVTGVIAPSHVPERLSVLETPSAPDPAEGKQLNRFLRAARYLYDHHPVLVGTAQLLIPPAAGALLSPWFQLDVTHWTRALAGIGIGLGFVAAGVGLSTVERRIHRQVLPLNWILAVPLMGLNGANWSTTWEPSLGLWAKPAAVAATAGAFGLVAALAPYLSWRETVRERTSSG